jgi:peptidoglycan DL-endopeptidase RipA
MKRIYGFILGLAVLAAPMAALSGLASADPTTKPMDYQQVTDTVVARGLAARGIPFSWAGGGVNGPSRGTGSGINTVGFDASGLMQYAYAGAGIKLPRSSGAIYQAGQKILPQQAQKGDMIFYGPNGTESVAMFLGNGQMLEVGDVVQVSPVRSSGMTPYVVRVLGTPQAPLQQAPAQQLPGQQAPAQAPLPGQQAPVQQLPGQQAPAQAPLPGQQAPVQLLPGQQAPVQAPLPGQQAPVQQAPLQQAAGQAPAPQAPLQAPAQPAPAPQAPVLQIPGQPPIQLPTLPTLQLPGQPAPAQQAPDQGPVISTFR